MNKTPKEYHVGNIFRRAGTDCPLGIYFLAAIDKNKIAPMPARR